MRVLSRRLVRFASAAIVGGMALAALAQEGAAPVTFSLFKGEENSVTLGGWGSGKAEVSRADTARNIGGRVKLGDFSIKVTTHGTHQGGRIDFAKPVDLSAALANPRCYLRLQVSFDATQDVQDISGFAQKKAAAPFERMRYVFIMADGSQYELVRPLDIPPSEDPDSYVAQNIPLSALKKTVKKPLAGNGAKLVSLVVAGDKYDTFYIGEMDVVTDDTEISVTDLDDQIAFIDNEMSFTGDAEGGSSTLKFSWDWDAADGIQEDDTGRTVKHVFPKTIFRGSEDVHKVIVTLTVSDVDGLKKPVSKKLSLEVGR
jgi:type 1 fimbria pilin